MAKMMVKKLDRPDETRRFDNGRAEILNLGDGTVGRGVFEPGWRWSASVKPLAGTESCEVTHLGIVQSGRMRVRMDDGQEAEVGPGDVLFVPPGHDAWTVGDEPCVLLDFAGMEQYALRATDRARGVDERPAQPMQF